MVDGAIYYWIGWERDSRISGRCSPVIFSLSLLLQLQNWGVFDGSENDRLRRIGGLSCFCS